MRQFIRGISNLDSAANPCVATIGNFDGVHRGHCEILNLLLLQAKKYQLPSVAIFLEPQPREYFSKEEAPARLMRVREKCQALIMQGVDQVCCLSFNKALRESSADEFIDQVLVKGLGVKCLVVGDDFHFGSNRSGNFDMLSEIGSREGFTVIATPTVKYLGDRVSSTRIRKALAQSDFSLAEELLNKPFSIEGRVAKGQRLATQLGMPTANVVLHRYAAPIQGVFAVEVELANGELYQGVANVGLRPTVEDRVKPILEVHLLDFSGDLYGQRISVRPLFKLREEKKFASLDLLVEAMNNDLIRAKQFFAAR